MPLPITKYCCSICGSEYRDFYEASSCEALGMPLDTDFISTGQSIRFNNEESLLGTRYSYSSEDGTVILKYVNLNTTNNGIRSHVWNYVIRGNLYSREYLAMFITDNYGCRALTSLAEWKFNPGFADSVRTQQGVHCV